MRCRLQNVVRSAQFGVLPLQALQLCQLVRRRPRPATRVLLGLANPETHRLGLRTQLLRDRADRFPLRPVLVAVIKHHPDRALTQLARVLPMVGRGPILLKGWSLHQTRGDSPRSPSTDAGVPLIHLPWCRPISPTRDALPVKQVSRRIDRSDVTFDDGHLVTDAGLLSVVTRSARLGIEDLITPPYVWSAAWAVPCPGAKVHRACGPDPGRRTNRQARK